ncbi:MAG: hypothetical protein ACPGU0_04145, partial [Marinirhabdus sp.]
MKLPVPLLVFYVFISCHQKIETPTIAAVAENSPFIEGKTEYLNSPYVTAGDRVYMVGHQDGSFPPLGWHITGEMGGIWDHPIKLMDGFDAALIFENGTLKLDKASKFINYPYASQHLFQLKKRGLTIERWQFVPDGKEGLAVQYILKNEGAAKNFQFKFTGRTDLRPTWLGERTQMLDAKDSAYFLNRHNAWAAKDSKNNWFTIFGPGNGTKIRSATTHNNGTNGVSNSLYLNIKIAEGGSKTLTFVIAGSYRSENEAVKTYNEIKANIKKLAIEKRERYKALAEKSKLTIPDKKIEQAFEWLAASLERPGWQAVVRRAALEGFGDLGDERFAVLHHARHGGVGLRAQGDEDRGAVRGDAEGCLSQTRAHH